MSTTTTAAPPRMPSVAELAAEREAATAAVAARKSNGGRKRTSASATADLVAAGIGYEETAKGPDKKAISQKPTAKEIAKARKVLAKLDGDTVPVKLGLSEAALRRFVRGEIKMAGLPEQGRAGVKALTSGIGSHQVWARKAAAMAYGIHKAQA